jgi:hypothetical protein
MKRWLFLIACCAALAVPAGAAAVTCAPPGVSGVNQYVETVPGSSCNHPFSGPGSGHNGGGGSLPPGTAKQLSKQGDVGKAVQGLVAATGPGSANAGSSSGRGSGKRSGSGAGSAGGGAGVSGSGRNPVSGILHPILTGSSGGGVGVLLPVFLGVALLLVLATSLLRRRLFTSGRHPAQ